jgi:hypothetical protein
MAFTKAAGTAFRVPSVASTCTACRGHEPGNGMMNSRATLIGPVQILAESTILCVRQTR